MSSPARRPRLGWALGAVAALLAAGGVALLTTAPRPEPPSVDPAAAATPVLVVPVEQREIEPRASFPGVVEPRRTVELVSETDGRVLELGAEALDAVDAEQLLVRVDPALARIAVARGRAMMARAESELALARQNLSRRRSLAKRNAVSAAALDEAESTARVAEATLREARATLAEARDRLAKKTLEAPFAGVLRSLTVERGQVVQPGQRVGELLDVSAARIVVGVSDREVVALAPGAKAEVTVEARPGERFSGTVLRIGRAADPVTRRFPVQVELPNDAGRLFPGMMARVTLALGRPEPVLLVPREAVREEYELRVVYVIEAGPAGGDAVARRRRVRVRELPFQPDRYAVLEGLEPGDEVIVTGFDLLRDGARVRPQRGSAS